ncbi:interferon gamma receptor 1-like precursor [Lates japonicus]
MDSVRFYPVFHFLVWLPAAVALVEVPSNVTFHCHNMHNILEWNYSQITPGLRFRVDIFRYRGNASELWVDPPALQVNLSFLSDPSNEYSLQLIAVIGEEESEPTPTDGISFSYFMNSPVSQKCSLDLPPVNVTTQPDDKILFRFIHPALWYHQQLTSSQNQKPRQKKSYDVQRNKLPLFKCKVVIDGQKEPPHHCHCVKNVCEDKLPVHSSLEKHCLNITGELENMAVKSSQLYCAMPIAPEQNKHIIYIVVGLLSVCVVAFVLFLVYQKKTRPSSALPSPLRSFKNIQNTAGPLQEKITVEKVEPSSPTPLLPCPEENGFTPAVTPSTEDQFRMPIGVSLQDEQADDDIEVGESGYEERGYMGGNGLDEDEILDPCPGPSGYEKRDVLVNMGPDDPAEGYRGNL